MNILWTLACFNLAGSYVPFNADTMIPISVALLSLIMIEKSVFNTTSMLAITSIIIVNLFLI